MNTKDNRQQRSEANELELGRIVGELIDCRKLIIGITTGFTVIAVLYALMATPIYQANALIQVEQKQGNAILSSLSQMLPDGQLQSAPEISLLQSRMILGKTVDDLNLQTQVEKEYFPIIGKGISRILNNKNESIKIDKLYIERKEDSTDPEIIITIKDDKHFTVEGDGFKVDGIKGEMLDKDKLRILITEINAEPGASFEVKYLSRLKAINNLLEAFNVSDQGKDTGMLGLTLTGTDPNLISKTLNSIANNYLEQNVERQAAQDAKSLDFLNQQLPKVRADLDIAEDKLNSYRKEKDSVDLSMEAKSVLDQIVNVDNQLNELTFREAEISQLYTKEHPTYKALIEKRQTLQQEKTKLNKRVSGMPSTQQEVLRLSRDVESGRAVYLQLLNRQQELSIAKSSAIGNVRIVDDSITDPKPIKPKNIDLHNRIYSGSLFSVALIMLRFLLRRGIESPEQLEEMGINVYASIPVSEWLLKASDKRKRKIMNQINYWQWRILLTWLLKL